MASDFYDTFERVSTVIEEELGADITWIDPGKLVNLTLRLSEWLTSA